MRFRRSFASYAIITCDSEEEVDNIDCSTQITEHLEVMYTERIADE